MTRATQPGHHEIHLLGHEAVARREVGADVVDEAAAVMVDVATASTHEVEVLVWMCHLPAGGILPGQVRLPHHV